MSLSDEHNKFLISMGIEPSRFEKLNRDINVLIEIAQDYEFHKNDLLDEASYIANKLQRCEGVHTVRSRIKETSHVIEKIIRKWECENVAQKYDTISKNNYKNIISDLIGVRAIYLFKNDWEIVHNHILSRWEPQEEVTIYYRSGDDLTKYDSYGSCKAEEHNKGYRSIHYIIPATKINNKQVNCEIQTRTIFEEGWSEIDHKVRYPSFSDNPYLQEFLDIFNRIAGSADEMGSFVNSLRELIQLNILLEENKQLIVQAQEEKIRDLKEKIDQLFKDKAELKEIEVAYNLLKLAQEDKNNIERNPESIVLGRDGISTLPTGNVTTVLGGGIFDTRKVGDMISILGGKGITTLQNGNAASVLASGMFDTRKVGSVISGLNGISALQKGNVPSVLASGMFDTRKVGSVISGLNGISTLQNGNAASVLASGMFDTRKVGSVISGLNGISALQKGNVPSVLASGMFDTRKVGSVISGLNGISTLQNGNATSVLANGIFDTRKVDNSSSNLVTLSGQNKTHEGSDFTQCEEIKSNEKDDN
ncbi:hypothetical protein [Acinetobacter pittii]|uniref:hypothetical protein n=1 Tax=Acinetobacter pittii TaxID=48296 RepID=UPI00388CF772